MRRRSSAGTPRSRRAPRHRSTSGRGRPLDRQRPGLARHTPGLGGRCLVAQPSTELAPPDRRGVFGRHSPGADADVEVHAFFSDHNGGMVEDPVTGSLNASLAQWLFETMGTLHPWRSHQTGASDLPPAGHMGGGSLRIVPHRRAMLIRDRPARSSRPSSTPPSRPGSGSPGDHRLVVWVGTPRAPRGR